MLRSPEGTGCSRPPQSPTSPPPPLASSAGARRRPRAAPGRVERARVGWSLILQRPHPLARQPRRRQQHGQLACQLSCSCEWPWSDSQPNPLVPLLHTLTSTKPTDAVLSEFIIVGNQCVHQPHWKYGQSHNSRRSHGRRCHVIDWQNLWYLFGNHHVVHEWRR